MILYTLYFIHFIDILLYIKHFLYTYKWNGKFKDNLRTIEARFPKKFKDNWGSFWVYWSL